MKWLLVRKSTSNHLWFWQVNKLIKLICGFKLCLEQLHLELIQPLIFNKFLELVVILKKAKAKAQKKICKLKLKSNKDRHKLNKSRNKQNKPLEIKLKRKRGMKKRREGRSKQSKKNVKDNSKKKQNKNV